MADPTPSIDSSQTYDAEQLVEEIESGEIPAPEINVADDYEASKEYSESNIDAEEAQAMTAPQLEMPEPEATQTIVEPTGDPEKFLDLAKDVNPIATEAAPIDDELLHKAFELGQPHDS